MECATLPGAASIASSTSWVTTIYMYVCMYVCSGDCNCRMMYSPYNNTRPFHPWGGDDCSFLFAYAAAHARFTHTYIHYIHTYIQTHIYKIFIYMNNTLIQIYCTYIYIQYIYTYKILIQTYIHTYTHTYILTYLHTYIHTYIQYIYVYMCVC